MKLYKGTLTPFGSPRGLFCHCPKSTQDFANTSLYQVQFFHYTWAFSYAWLYPSFLQTCIFPLMSQKKKRKGKKRKKNGTGYSINILIKTGNKLFLDKKAWTEYSQNVCWFGPLVADLQGGVGEGRLKKQKYGSLVAINGIKTLFSF